jgi:glycerol uptake facilitator-like aquaporin
MNPSSTISFWNQFVFTALPLILAQFLGSIAVIAISDWHGRSRAERTAMSVRDLEALFALPDLRESRPHRTRG